MNWRWRFCRPLPYHLAMPPIKKLERETGFEPATSTLARLHSTTELLPLSEKIFYAFLFRLSSAGLKLFPNRSFVPEKRRNTDC